MGRVWGGWWLYLKAKSKKNMFHQLLESCLCFLGVSLCLWGCHNLINAVLQPGAFSGACFACLGVSIAITFSDDVKVFVLNNLFPRGMISLLYEK